MLGLEQEQDLEEDLEMLEIHAGTTLGSTEAVEAGGLSLGVDVGAAAWAGKVVSEVGKAAILAARVMATTTITITAPTMRTK